MFSGEYLGTEYRNLIATMLSILGVWWLVIQILQHFFSADIAWLNSVGLFIGMVTTSVFIALLIRMPKLRFTSRISNKDVTVSIQIGNLLYRDGDLAIGTNSTFDTDQANGFITPKSVQAQLVKLEYDNVSHVDGEIESELIGIPFNTLSARTTKTKRYPIGTVVKLNNKSGRRSYWIALSDVNKNGKPAGNYEDLFVGLQQLWTFIEEKGHIADLHVPILGSGKTGFDATRSQIIKDIIFSFIEFTKEKKIVDSLTICIHPLDLKQHDIDLDKLHRYMDYHCEHVLAPSNHGSSGIAV